MPDSTSPVPVEALAAVVREAVPGARDAQLAIEEITRHTNLNFVYRVVLPDRTLFVKAIPARLKRFGVPLPQSRIHDEVRAMRLFGDTCGGAVVVPEIAFVHEPLFLLGMTDVSAGRVLVADACNDDRTLAGAASALGAALANVHSRTRGFPNFRSPSMDATIRQTIFGYLVVPPAELGEARGVALELMADVRDRAECLVHGDLWPKNLFVGGALPPAIIDFEGALTGDPAFDLATIGTASLFSVLESPSLLPGHVDAIVSFFAAYRERAIDQAWADAACARALRLMGVFTAVRAFGPTAFPMSEAARSRAADVAKRLVTDPPAVDDYSTWIVAAI